MKASLALDNIGLSGSWNDGTTSSEFGLSANLSEFSIEGKWSVTNESTTTYTKFGVSGWFIAAVAYAIHSGDISMLERSAEYAK